jgi:hypothetical protein
MDINELKSQHPQLFQQVFAMGYDAGIKCQLNPGRDNSEKRRIEAADLIADSGKNRIPSGFARVDRDGQGYVVPTY